MEENREPTSPAPSSGIYSGPVAPPVPPAPPADWVAHNAAYAAPAPGGDAVQSTPPAPPKVGWVALTVRLVRLLLLRGLYMLGRLGQALRPHAGWLAALSVLLGIIFVQAFLLVAPRFLRSNAADVRVTLITPPQAVVSFLEGQSTFNADLMWEAFSPEFQANLIQLGASKESIAAQAEDERLAGRRYGDPAYIGGIQLGDRSRYYYVVTIESPQPDEAGSFSFIFTVNRDGKIVGVQRE